jgi:hypothetical protein
MLPFALAGSPDGGGDMMTTKVSLYVLQIQSGKSYEKKFVSNDIVEAFVGTRIETRSPAPSCGCPNVTLPQAGV